MKLAADSRTAVHNFQASAFWCPRIRAVKKEQKHYQFDWSLAPSKPARFENLIASHLLKWVNFEQDTQGRDIKLRYFRDTRAIKR